MEKLRRGPFDSGGTGFAMGCGLAHEAYEERKHHKSTPVIFMIREIE